MVENHATDDVAGHMPFRRFADGQRVEDDDTDGHSIRAGR